MSDSPYTLEDLVTPETSDVIRARLIAALLADGQPTASWAPSSAGGAENLRADMVAGGLAFFMATRVANVVNGRLLPLATDSAENGYWLTYLGKRFYKLTKRKATKTIQNIRLTVAPAASAVSLTDGSQWVASPSTGNRYRLTLAEGQTLELRPGQSADGTFYAENPGAAYSDPEGTITQMVTARPGITCVNVRPSPFAPTRSTNSSTGTVTASYAVAPPYASVRVRINVSGAIGTGSWSYSTDGGAVWVPGGVIGPSILIPGGVTINFSNGVVGTTPFVAGAIFTMRVGDCFLQRGSDNESDADFRRRCANRHPARSLVPLKAHIDLWAHNASDEVNKVVSAADPNISGGILVTIASFTGPASVGAQEACEDYIRDRLGHKGVPAPTAPTVPNSGSPEETVQLSSAAAFSVQTTGSVYIPRAQLPAARKAADAAWNAYLASLPLGGQRNALVERERFYTLMGDLGADDVQELAFNGVQDDATIPVRQVAVPLAGWTLFDGLSWVAT